MFKFLLILVVGFYLFLKLLQFSLRIAFWAAGKHLQKQAMQKGHFAPQQPSPRRNRRDEGEYVDYEEV
jgi:hypothetical protein